ncbi:MAG: hypothetical protein WAX04_12250 [Oscillospiraceae bacterium]
MKSVLNSIMSVVLIALMFTSCAQKADSQSANFNDSEAKFPGLIESSMMGYFGEEYEPPVEYGNYLLKKEVSFDDVKTKLMEKTDIIPFEGELGGTFFIVDDMLKQVGDQWIYAYAEDGHITLDLLIKFSIDKDNTINFVVAATDYNAEGTKLYAVPEEIK